MTIGTHVTDDDLRRIRHGEMPPSDVAAAGRHLAACTGCASRASASVGDRPAAMFARVIGEAELYEHPDPETELPAYVEGSLDAETRARVTQHLEDCDVCREDVADLEAMRFQRRRPSSPAIRWLAAAAALLVIAASAIFVWMQSRAITPAPPSAATSPTTTTTAIATHEAPPPVRSYGNDAWDRMMRTAIATGTAAVTPALAELRVPAERLRGGESAERVAMEPDGVIVDTARPRFTWPHAPDARATVTVFDGDTNVARSEALTTSSWRPERDLPREVALGWQVRIERKDGSVDVLPSAPAPPALFRIAGRAALEEIERAGREFPEDHFLVALLCAKHGLLDRAEQELMQHVNAHPNDKAAKDILRRLRSSERT